MSGNLVTAYTLAFRPPALACGVLQPNSGGGSAIRLPDERLGTIDAREAAYGYPGRKTGFPN